MLTSLMSAELVAARHTELIAAAEAERLARRVGRTRRDERRFATAARVGRIWLRSRTPDASPMAGRSRAEVDGSRGTCGRPAWRPATR
jgi:hypothetical protein